jgi:regulator of sirC expression with transglutaminase-like and TPR domain
MLSDEQINKLKALISMVDEPDETIYKVLRKQIINYKKDAYRELENAWVNTNDIFVANRLEELISEVNFIDVEEKIKSWLEKKDNDIITAMLSINQLEYPDANENELRKHIELIKKDTWLEINDNLTALEKIKVINHVFYVVHKFYSPKLVNKTVSSFFLSNLIITKTGNPTSLGLVYLAVVQSIKLPIFGIDFPEHLILTYLDDSFFSKNIKEYTRSDIMFYINPFNKGSVFTYNEIELYLKQMKLKNSDAFYLPAGNKTLIKRYLNELKTAYSENNQTKKSKQIIRLLKYF